MQRMPQLTQESGSKVFFLIKGSLSSKKPWEDYLLCCVIFEALCLKFDKNDCIFYGTFLLTYVEVQVFYNNFFSGQIQFFGKSLTNISFM